MDVRFNGAWLAEWCGLMGGVFFAFSSFVIKGLARLPAPQGIAAMQSINVVPVTPVFITALFGTAAACAVLAIFALLSLESAGAVHLLAGCLLYLFGAILVTMVFNVPRNNSLAAVDVTSSDAPIVWARFVSGWTAWNHVRAAASLAAAVALTLSLIKATV